MIRYEEKVIKTDVLVIGGGPGGIMCALAAARNGCRTTLIERSGYLGGCATQSLALPLMSFHADGTKVVCGYADALIERMQALGGTEGHLRDPITGTCSVTPIDTEVYKYVAQEMLLEAGVQLLLHTDLIDLETENGRITRAFVRTYSGNYIIEADYYADATGSAEAAMLAGVETKIGRDSDHMPQPMSMLFKMQNVDRDALNDYIRAHPEIVVMGEGITPEYFCGSGRLCIAGFFPQIAQAQKNGDFSSYRDRVLVFETNRPGEVSVNMSRIIGKSAAVGFEMSEAAQIGRRQIMEIANVLRKYIPGFAEAYISESAAQIGIRESRRIQGKYVLTAEDILNRRQQEDSIALGCWPIDIHSPDGSGLSDQQTSGGYYQIPYRCLYSDAVSNLLAAGRIISATYEAFASVRVAPTCFVIGQAAGTALALAKKHGCAVSEVSVPALQKRLLEEGQKIN